MFCLDPVPPTLQQPLSYGLTLAWDAVKFCGVNAPAMLESVTYTIEIAEGVEWRDDILSRFVNDTTATSYRAVFKGKNTTSATLPNLKPATWYHVRLLIDYLGLEVMSETVTVHTLKAEPSSPGMPKIALVPVSDPFDVNNFLPARYEVLLNWAPSLPHGYPLEKYQVQLRRYDLQGQIVLHEPNLIVKRRDAPKNAQRTISILLGGNKANNQWTQSPGKSEVQIRHSLKTREGKHSRQGLVSSSSAHWDAPSSHSRPGSRTNSRTGSPVGFLDLSADLAATSSAPSSSASSSWKVIYDKLPRTTKLYSPPSDEGEWWIRVRAKNAAGWSAFSPIMIINHYQYPSLFPEPVKGHIPRPAGLLADSNNENNDSNNNITGNGMFFPPETSISAKHAMLTSQTTETEQSFSNNNTPERPVTRLNRQYGGMDHADDVSGSQPTTTSFVFERRQSNLSSANSSSFLPDIRRR